MTKNEARMLLVPIRNEYKARSEQLTSQLERDIYAMLTEAIEMGMEALEGPHGCFTCKHRAEAFNREPCLSCEGNGKWEAKNV